MRQSTSRYDDAMKILREVLRLWPADRDFNCIEDGDKLVAEHFAQGASSEKPAAEKSNESVELWMPCAQTAEYGWVYLPGYADTFEHGVIQKIMDAARRERFFGTINDRLEQLRWKIVKLVARPVSENDR